MVALEEIAAVITPLYIDIMGQVKKRLDSLTKPIGSLGRLEDIVMQLAGISGEVFPKVDKKNVIIMCADNGVVEEGVSSCPKSVTAEVTRNFTRGITGINIFARHANSDITIVDIGVDAEIECQQVLNRKIRWGTGNIAKGPAMSKSEAIKAIETGIDIVSALKKKGVNLLGTGEMGIGNTTTASAIVATYADCPVDKVVGKGAGLTKEAYHNKIAIVKKAIEVNQPDKKDPIDVLSKVGGLDIAGLAGCFIGAAYNRIPILIDGFISGSAALIACKIHPLVKEYIIPSHGSAEPGTEVLMSLLEMEPMLNLKMRLGEGTGAALAFHIIDAAVAAYNQMGTFQDANIEQYEPLE
ncbi:MAG: nicotinate-nucleotide--dimethylbenzimidazole phosphoribosyltransferase [Petroclostridium sp.]|jgi:nicotinate-nucleotide--dimethylbenzimidazole phosphoribosyltransferase|uniref:nicotinate-nucleotide--dimethylbenzimidazole phosphoribosyltransferase n=1 Tax=Petroclostridium xylanilyticum TaxID=1792311 RepID=UPI000B98D945|nr:nicotinate-nucleotide--dimethylbenzimidazole phosphoribosyltransferase [Petroclostridium xylanilyticum]MBZ4644850.1 cobT [Clostridia bacterium]MDK2809569.1 nicotinate-nucleotide--dimethylbenzimidazole phosphoribosyltransferase [Petroclostridium sp.]